MRCLCWLDEDYILVGCLDGIIHLWRIGGEIRVSDLTLPFLSFYSLFFPFFLSLPPSLSLALSLSPSPLSPPLSPPSLSPPSLSPSLLSLPPLSLSFQSFLSMEGGIIHIRCSNSRKVSKIETCTFTLYLFDSILLLGRHQVK